MININLLPDKQKLVIHLEEIKARVWLVLFYFFLGLFAFIIFLSLLAGLAEITSRNVLNSIRAQEDLISQPAFQADKAEIERLNKEFAFLNQFEKNKVFFSNFLEKLEGVTPYPVFFEKIALKKQQREVVKNQETGEKETQFFAKGELEGQAKTREDLYDFRLVLLNENSWIENPYFLPISWKLAVNSEFLLSLNYFLSQNGN